VVKKSPETTKFLTPVSIALKEQSMIQMIAADFPGKVTFFAPFPAPAETASPMPPKRRARVGFSVPAAMSSTVKELS
jgi:hypothetical protein